MAVSRADALTGTKKQLEFFSDFNNNFNKTPFGNQLARLVNENSVEQSLRNLIKTNLGERLFQPTIGSDIYASLFENNFPENLTTLELFIKTTIRNNEPRVILNNITVTSDSIDEHTITVRLEYSLINNPEELTLDIILKRVR
jgi:phage baseplate assembly protein W